MHCYKTTQSILPANFVAYQKSKRFWIEHHLFLYSFFLMMHLQTSHLTSVCLADTSALPQPSFISSSCFTTAKPGFSNAISHKSRKSHQILSGWLIFCCQKASDLSCFLHFTACHAVCSQCFVCNPGFRNISTVKCDIFTKSSKSLIFTTEQRVDVLLLFKCRSKKRNKKHPDM